MIDTLTASLWCLLTTDNFSDCVLKAVNLGGDTDTTGCVAGGLFAGQMAASAWWLRRFSYGPVEWVLRALTIGRWPAMRRMAQWTMR